ncbi:oligosaccharide flippase family protein [Flavobacterium sp. Sd200]|uniref:lipopolysaccharide biosynthesis protein n=1 Tax=Flavobacterium sp. Sd200 TaxID=2692211 RepID=UPI00136B2A9D|nr:polysaccharide biosynthesis C-terminal domain-containing protein [Flavobacterium sp. Sd200]MXN90876.1 oligosaccharide flippase family protein [Flavobacterium sp. Sd200]
MKSKLQKQAILYSIINYSGTFIGVISALFIYPLNYELSGTIGFIDNISQMLFPIMVLGASHALIKFYPGLSEKHQKQLFNYSLASISVIGVVVFLVIVLLNFFGNYKNKELLYFAFPVALALSYIELFRKQAQDMRRLAVPTLFEKIIPKIILPLLFILLINNFVGFYTSLTLYACCYIAIFFLIGIYLFKYYKPGFNYSFKELFEEIPRNDYYKYSLYSFAGSLGSLLAFRIDGIIIFEYISEEANGIFRNGVTLASTMQIPAMGLFALYAPLISADLKAERYKELNVKYKEIARLLFFIGAIFYGCIFLGLEELFRILPAYDKLKDTIPIIKVLGFSVLINMATGFNTEIITYSKYYRFNMIAILSLVVLNVGLNIWFISLGYGIMGVAFASFISMTTFNVSKLIFLKKKFDLLPFDGKFLKMAIVFLLAGFAVWGLPKTDSHFMNLIYKTSLYVFVTVMVVYRLRLVYQLNVWVKQALKKFIKLQ